MTDTSLRLVTTPLSRLELATIAAGQFGDMVKAVVDIKKKIMVIGGELHADEEALLLEQGSRQTDLWGINLYPEQTDDGWIEFDSMINIRPSQNNRSRNVEDELIRARITAVVKTLVL